MTTIKPLGCLAALLFALPLLAQTTATPPPAMHGATQGGGTSCWQKAGIPPSIDKQRREIEMKTHGQIQEVCNDSSLNAQQKKEKIQNLRNDVRARTKALLTPEQQQAVAGCRDEHQERGQGTGGSMQGGGKGPCGNMPSPAAAPQN